MKTKLIICYLILFLINIYCNKTTQVVTYPAPADEKPSADYILKVNGKEVFVYQARVSAVPHNQLWPGHQRPKEQTELASFAYFDCSGPVSVEVISDKNIESVDIRPKSYNIKSKVTGNTIKFNISRPCKITVEINGAHNALHLFANEIEKNRPEADALNVRYFCPGTHNAGIIKMHDNETVYIAGGAVVNGVIEAVDASNIKILGRGILDAGTIGRFDAKQMIALHGCKNVQIDGIILRDPHKWTITPLKCKNVEISDVKLIGLWRYNSDGIDIVNCQNVSIRNCFIRSYDDNIALKGLKRAYAPKERKHEKYNTEDMNIRNIEVSDCVLWGDWGRAIEIGAETVADSIGYIVFKNCDIIHYVHYAMDIQNGDRAVVHNVKYENIRVEEPTVHNVRIADRDYNPSDVGKLIVLNINKNYYSKDTKRGQISDITFKNITFTGSTSPKSLLLGLDSNHIIKNITFDNILINGKHIENAEQCNMTVNEYVKNVTFK